MHLLQFQDMKETFDNKYTLFKLGSQAAHKNSVNNKRKIERTEKKVMQVNAILNYLL